MTISAKHWTSPWRAEFDAPTDGAEHAELVARARAALADVPWLEELLGLLEVVVYVDGTKFGVFLPSDPESPEVDRLVIIPPISRAIEIAAAGCVWAPT